MRKIEVAGKAGYGTTQDGVLHYGMSNTYLRLDSKTGMHQLLGKAQITTENVGGDLDFVTVAGNLVFFGNDGSAVGGNPLFPHQAGRDSTPPSVIQLSPRDGATGLPATARVGFSMTDHIDPRTIGPDTFIVRKMGGETLPGSYSQSHQGAVNFTPGKPLDINATYEIVLPEGGLRDWAGNAIASTFTARFSTGSQPLVAQPARDGGAPIAPPATSSPDASTSTTRPAVPGTDASPGAPPPATARDAGSTPPPAADAAVMVPPGGSSPTPTGTPTPVGSPATPMTPMAPAAAPADPAASGKSGGCTYAPHAPAVGSLLVLLALLGLGAITALRQSARARGEASRR
jgi:hypothetical protein